MPDQRNPDPNRRPTKAEKRDEARRKREELQRQLAKRKRTRIWGILAIVLAAALVVGIVILQPFAGTTPADVLSRAPAARTAATCGPVQTIEPYQNDDPAGIDRTHVGASELAPVFPSLSSYPSIPPTSGPHSSVPLTAGVYDEPPPIDQAIHALEHGAAIVWYDPAISGAVLTELKDFYSQRLSNQDVKQDRVIVAPYDYPDQGAAGQLPAGTGMALVAWHRLQTCAQVNLPVAFDFTSQYAAPPWGDRTYKGEAPEAGGSL